MDRSLFIYGNGVFRSFGSLTKLSLRTLFFLFLWFFFINNSSAQITTNFSASTTQGCSPLVVCFTDLSTGNPNTWLWNFGNSNLSPDHNPCAIYIVPGTYTVSLTASNGGNSDTKTVTALITVFANPVANFSPNKTIGCAPETISFTDMSVIGDAPIVSWRWDFGDGNTSFQQNPTNVYTNPGTYTVYLEVTDANGCTHRYTRNNLITILSNRTVDFSAAPSFGCTFPATINFTDLTLGGMLTDWLWDFGDGNTSAQQNPSHTYNLPGSYTVELTVTNAGGCTKTTVKNDFMVIEDMQADFSVSDTSGCGSVTVNFADQSTAQGAIISYAWDFGDGATSNVQNTTHTYNTVGVYDVSLIITTNKGCRDTIVYDDLIHVFPRPTVNFDADQTLGCANPFVVNFTEDATDDASWLWDFGNGNTSTLQNPTHNYTAPGSYGVRLTVTSADGCTRSRFKANYITVNSPVADFSANVQNGCIDLTVNFIDQSTSSEVINAWVWNFGDGTPLSNAQNPSHIYTSIGQFDVTLIIRTVSGCYDTIIQPGFIAAGDTPTVVFGSDRQHVCLGTPINFYDSTDTGNEWQWDFGDGGSSTDSTPTYTYTDTGAFSVTLVVLSNGCADTLTIDDYVSISPPRAGINPTFNCLNPFEVVINDNSLGPNQWHWDFGDGDTSNLQNNTHMYDTTGNYNIHLFVRDTMSGCVDSTDLTIRITDPVADFAGTNLVGCYPLIVNFTSSSVDADTYQWFFGDGDTSSQQNPIKVYDTSGVFDVMLIITDIHGCSDTFTIDDYVTVYGATAWFEADTLYGCTPLHVDYSDLSSSFLGTVTGWTWDFGDSTTSVLQNPGKDYTEPGIYSISLRVSDSNGCIDSTMRVNYIIPTFPNPDFSADDTIVCVGQDIYFDNTSVGTGMLFLWNFGDGSTSNDSLPTHAYSAEGVYTVSLTATDINGCDSTITKPLYIRVVQPQAALTADSTFASCPPLWVNFTDLTPANDSITDWLWDFGDNQTSDLQHPTHVYTTPDTFIPSLLVIDFNGCSDTAVFIPITVTGPVGNFDFIQPYVCVPVPVQFFSDAADTLLHIYDYGDGSVGVYMGGDTITHNYTYPGVFHPSLILDDLHGCIITIDHPDSIITFTVIADFSSDIQYLCHASLVSFYDSSLGFSNPVSWFWDFGDGDTSTLQNPTHYYGVPGSYDVMLVVTNAEGCTDTMLKPRFITVDPGPVADFNMSDNDVCIPETVFFTDASVSDSTIISWEWNFGDGNSSTQQNPANVYTTVDTFAVTLMIETVAGCRDTVTKQIITHGPPVADAGPASAICFGDSAQLNGSGGVTYSWSPAATVSDSTIANPVVSPLATTTYYLTVTNSLGCPDVDSVTITVHPLPVINTAGSTICVGDSAQLIASGGVIYAWSPAASLNDSTISNPFASPLATTTYTVTVTDVNGCVNTASTTINVNPLPVPTVSAANSILCGGQSVQLNATGGVSYSWSPATWLNFTNIPNPVANLPIGGATYVVTVTDSNGCMNRDTISIDVYPMPVYNISGDMTMCVGDTAELAVIGGDTYYWYPSAGLSCDTCGFTSATPDTTTLYYVEITNSLGCTVTDSILITVNPIPVVTITNDATVCATSPIQLNATGGVSYSWSPASFLNATNIPNPRAMPFSSTTYTVLVTDSNGCTNTGSVTVSTNPLPIANASGDTAICIGGSAQLWASGGVNYQWFPDSSLNCGICPNVVATPTQTTTYQVNIINGFGCMVTRFLTVTVNPLPVVTVSNDTFICSGSSTQLNATGGASYIWFPSAGLSNANIASPIATPDSSTTYIVLTTSAFGCLSTDTVQVEVLQFHAAMQLSDTLGCLPVNVQFTDLSSASDSIVSWNWDFDNTKTSTVQHPYHAFGNPGTYNVQLTITSTRGCVDSTNGNVTVLALPYADAGPDTAICRGESVVLQGSGVGSYDWSPSVGLNAINIANPTATPNVTRYYELIVTDNATGCRDRDSVLITVNDLPVTTISAGTSLCYGDSTQLEVTGGTYYTWTPATGLNNPNISNPVAMPEGTTIYTVEVETEFGCTALDSVMVVVRPLPDIQVKAADEICFGDSTQFEVSGASTYEWLPTTGLSCSICPNPIVKPDSSTTYLLRMTDAYNCVWLDTLEVIVNPIPEVTTTADQTICKGEEVELTSQQQGATAFLWSPTIGLSASDILSPIAAPESTTEYIITALNAFGCQDKDTVVITVIDRVQTTINESLRLCMGESVTLEVRIDVAGISGGQVIWLPQNAFDDPTQLEQIVSPSASTNYTLVVFGGACVPDTQFVHVHVDSLPTVDAGPDQLVMAGTEVEFTATSHYNISSYYWSPSSEVSCYDCQTVTHVAEQSGTFYVSVVDANGCPAMDSVNVRVIESCEGDIWVPNAFTPNGDEMNDEFRVRSSGMIQLIHFRVFDRWGNQVFETDNFNEGWNGKYKDEMVNPNVYVWYVRASCPDGRIVDLKGNVTAIR